jgi:hypothetical protein
VGISSGRGSNADAALAALRENNTLAGFAPLIEMLLAIGEKLEQAAVNVGAVVN